MAEAKGLKVVGYFDCPGGGQVVVRNNIAYVGHVLPPDGTTIIDVADPAKPRWLANIQVPKGTLSHKVRVENGIMLVNREIFPIGRQDPDFHGGLEVFDVSTPSNPKHIATWAARGMHRFTFDGRYVYGSPELDGYLGNVVGIIDFQNPARPELVGKWWMPGQWTAGGENADLGRHRPSLPPPDAPRQPALRQLLARRLRHPQHRRHHQAEIHLRPRLESAVSLADAHGAAGAVSGARTPDHAGGGRRRRAPRPRLAARFYGSSTSPTKRGQFPSPAFRWRRKTARLKPDYTGLHQSCEEIRSTEIPIAWFAHGLRIVDIANPHAPREVASFMPDVPQGRQARAEQRRLLRRPRAHLSDRPHTRTSHPRTHVTSDGTRQHGKQP